MSRPGAGGIAAIGRTRGRAAVGDWPSVGAGRVAGVVATTIPKDAGTTGAKPCAALAMFVSYTNGTRIPFAG